MKNGIQLTNKGNELLKIVSEFKDNLSLFVKNH